MTITSCLILSLVVFWFVFVFMYGVMPWLVVPSPFNTDTQEVVESTCLLSSCFFFPVPLRSLTGTLHATRVPQNIEKDGTAGIHTPGTCTVLFIITVLARSMDRIQYVYRTW